MASLKYDPSDRKLLNDEATEAFRDWVIGLSDGELYDMMVGNASSYHGIPDLSQWVDRQNIDSPLQFLRAEDE